VNQVPDMTVKSPAQACLEYGIIPVVFAKSKAEWAERVPRHLKAELKRAGLTYEDLTERLKKHGFKDESKTSIAKKLARGTFTATFFSCP
jgi:hypothetical protein